MRKILYLLAASLVALFALTACISGEPSTATTEETKAPATDVLEPTADPAWGSKPGQDKVSDDAPKGDDLMFGDTFKYDDGTTITVSKPRELAAPYAGETWEGYAEYDTVPENSTPVVITMKLTAGEETIDPSGAYLTVLAGDKELEAMCFGEGVDCGSMLSQLRPGKSVTIEWSYWLPKGAALTVEASPTWDHEPALYN